MKADTTKQSSRRNPRKTDRRPSSVSAALDALSRLVEEQYQCRWIDGHAADELDAAIAVVAEAVQ